MGQNEEVDMLVVQLAAILHDIADHKFHDGDETAGPRVAREWLQSQLVAEDIIQHVCSIIAGVSFKGANVEETTLSKEGQVVQDADRLDAIGAIGIGRTFTYGGHTKREMYNPHIKPEQHTTKEAYMNNKSPTLNHFYEKLLLLKGLMNTETAKRIAAQRHEFMKLYLDQFYAEWDGKK
ncbi:phosphohydrolase [archaeon]|nr:phosphohydrolase [archaeon]